MCKAPKPPKQKEPDKPEFLRNRYLDAVLGKSGVVNQIRKGRADLRIRPGGADINTLPPSGLNLGDADLSGFVPDISIGGAGRTSRTPSIGPRPINGRQLTRRPGPDTR